MSEAESLELHPRYALLQCIAQGGMGAIYLAEQHGSLGFRKVVALKRLRRELLGDPESTARFAGEAILVADLIHENIAQVYHLEQLATGELVIAMEFVPGRNLDEIGERLAALSQTLPPELACFIASRVCRGLGYAHRKRDEEGRRLKIVHRDISPSNILVSFGGVVKIVDFGIAKARTMATPDEREVIQGKLPYMAPEVARYAGSDSRSDLYSLGLVLYEMLTGRQAYPATRPAELLEMQEHPPISPRQLVPGLSEEVEAIVMRSLAHDPDERYASAEDMGLALERALYERGYGPTNLTLARFIAPLFPEVRRGGVS